jgi:hypothetical protein
VNALLFLHVLVAMLLAGGLITAAVCARFELWSVARWSAVAALVGTIAAIGLGEGLAADESVSGGWLDASRGLAVFGLLLGSAGLVIATGSDRLRRFAAPWAAALIVIALATAFVMAAKPS